MKGGKKTKYVLLAIIIGIALQFVPVTRDNPPVTGDFNEDDAVRQVFRRSCYNCHSNETSWPWYSKVAPVSWLVASDVQDGRRRLNFSTWASMHVEERAVRKGDILAEINAGEMPLGRYLLLHPSARLSDADKAAIRRWAETRAVEDVVKP